MAALVQQCATCKKGVVDGEFAMVNGFASCAACDEALCKRTDGGSAALRVLGALVHGAAPLIHPPPPPPDLKARRKEFTRWVVKRTKELGLRAFKANKMVTTVQDYIRLATVYTIKHPTHVLLIWLDMEIPWCVEWANTQYAQTGVAGVYGVHWVCLYQDNYSNGTWGDELDYRTAVFDLMIDNAGKPPRACWTCSEPLVDSVMCKSCKKETCSLCKKRWFDTCSRNGRGASCPFCREPYELRVFTPNVSGIISALKE